MQLSRGFLLEGGCGERGGGPALSFFLLHLFYLIYRRLIVFEELACLILIFKILIQLALDAVFASYPEISLAFIIFFRHKCYNLPFPIHHKPERNALHPPCRQTAVDFSPKDGGELEAYQAVQYAACLLGVYKVHVYVTRILDGAKNSVFGDFVEDYSAYFFLWNFKYIRKMPRDGFSFAVLIGCEQNQLGFICKFFQLRHHPLLFIRNYIFRLESILYIYTKLLFMKVADMSVTRFHGVFFSKKTLYGFCLCRRLYYYKLAALIFHTSYYI